MRTTQISYSKVFSLGNYENEKIGVEIEIQEGDNIQSAIQNARQFVEFNHKLNGFHKETEHLEYVINNPDEFTGNDVKRAKERLADLQEKINQGIKLLS